MLVFGPTRYAKALHCGRVAVEIIIAVHKTDEAGMFIAWQGPCGPLI